MSPKLKRCIDPMSYDLDPKDNDFGLLGNLPCLPLDFIYGLGIPLKSCIAFINWQNPQPHWVGIGSLPSCIPFGELHFMSLRIVRFGFSLQPTHQRIESMVHEFIGFIDETTRKVSTCA